MTPPASKDTASKRVVPWLALLLLAGIGIGWFLIRNEGAPASEPARLQGTEEAASGAAVVELPSTGVAREAAGEASEPEPGEPAESNAPNDDSPFEGLTIRVVIAATGEPVPGIDITLLDRRRVDSEGLLLAMAGQDPNALLHRFGRRIPTDEHGIARVPRPSPGNATYAFAEHEELFGSLELYNRAPDELQLRLAQDSVVRVRVVDALRRPVTGIDVALHASEDDRELARASSDADGLAELRRWHAQLYPKEEVRVRLVLIAAESIEASFDRNAPPTEPIELVAPACGRVVVDLTRPDGGPAGPGFAVKVARPRAAGRLGRPSFWYREPGQALHAIASGGRAVFETVPVGQGELEVGVLGPGFEPSEARITGPVAPGETVAVRLALGAATPLVVGRIVHADGRPLASTHLDVQVIFRPADEGTVGGSAYDEIATDGDGRFRCPLPPGVERPAWFDFHLTLEEDDGLRRTASFELPGDVSAGETDVGTLVLADTPVLAAGVVVDEHDRPVRGATVSCKEKIVFDGGAWGWSTPQAFMARTRSDGTFAIRARSPHPIVYVDTSRDGYLPLEDVEVGTGRRDLSLVLRPAAPTGTIAGRVIAESSSVQGLGITLRRLDQAGQLPESPLYSSEFQLSDVPAGTYALELRFLPERRELARIEGIEVLAGQTTRDPRLDPLDLRESLRVFRVRVVGEDGHALPAFGIARRLPGESDYSTSAWNSYGEATREVSTTSPVLDLRVEAIGKRSVELLSVDGDREVMLEPGIPVRVVLTGERPTLPAAAKVVLSLHSKAHQVGVVAVHESLLDAAGSADLLVGEPGEYRLQIKIQLPSEDGFGASASVRGNEEFDVEVHDTAEPEVVSRAVNAEAWGAALGKLGVAPSDG